MRVWASKLFMIKIPNQYKYALLLSQNTAKDSLLEQLYAYDKRHGWKEPNNYSDIFNEQEALSLSLLDLDFLFNNEYTNNIDLDSNLISNKILSIFDLYPCFKLDDSFW